MSWPFEIAGMLNGRARTPLRADFTCAIPYRRDQARVLRRHMHLGLKPLRLVVLLCCAWLPPHLRAEVSFSVPTEIASGVTINISSPIGFVSNFGFLPLRVSIENLTSRDGTWRFEFDAGVQRFFPGTASSTFQLDAPATQTREAWFFVPLAGPGVSVDFAALTAGSGAGLAPIPPAVPRTPGAPARAVRPARAHGITNIPSLLMVEVAGPGVRRSGRTVLPNTANNAPMGPLATTPALEQVVRGKFAGSGSRTPPNVTGFEPAHLPADWRVWSAFNNLLLATDDFEALDGARQAAIRTWIASGGVLLLSPASAGEGRMERVGAGQIETLAGPIADFPPAEVFERLRLGDLSPGMPDRDAASFAPGTAMGEIVRFEPVDSLWLSLFLIAFAALIGPVNIFWLAPATKRHRLFFTTPLISLLGAAAVAGTIVLEDGLGGAGIRRLLVWLVPGGNQAVIFQEQAARTGFLLRREFPLRDDVLCAALPVDGNVNVFTGANRIFTRDNGLAGGDWFGNRSRQAQLLRSVAPTRARIELVGTAADGAPIIESTVVTELRNFRLRDASGRTWVSPSVPTGQRITLSPADAGISNMGTTADGTPHLTRLMTEAASLTDPWQWVATGGRTDFAPIPTLASIRWTDDPIVYAGWAERAPVGPRAPGSREVQDGQHARSLQRP